MSRRQPLVLLLGALLAVAACSRPAPGEQAARAACAAYAHLAAGRYQQFLQLKAGADSLPADYREQLLTACRQFVAQQQRAHGGISGVRVSSVRTDSLDAYTSVFLILSFADSLTEEIVVPMVEHNGEWRMK